MRTIAAAFAALAVSGCATDVVWHKHGAGPGQLEHDRAGCNYEAQMRLATYSGPHLPRPQSVGEAFAQGIAKGIDVEVRKDALVTACMQARGYHAVTIEAASTTAPAPPAAAAESVFTPPPYDGQPVAPSATPAAYSDPRDRMNLPAEPPAPPHPSFTQGQYAFVVEKMAKSEKCEPKGNAKIITSGPGFEHYSVSCADGEALAVRCDLGNCRVLK